MILIVGEDEVFAAGLARDLGDVEVTHAATVEEALQIFEEKRVSVLLLVGEAKAFRKLKKLLQGQALGKQSHSFLIQSAEPSSAEVVAGYKLGVDMVLKRDDDLADVLRKFV